MTQTPSIVDVNSSYLSGPISPEQKHPVLDRCWATPISAAGATLGVVAAHEIVKKRYVRGAAAAVGSAVCDFLDGIEARRFAKRNPEEGLARRNRGAWIDPICDRIRNVAIGSAVLTVDEVPPRAKAVVGAIVAKETVTGVVSIKSLLDHASQYKEGWPAALQPADRGKESMWEVGAGLAWVVLGARIKESNPELGQKITKTAAGLCGIGLLRGLQTAPEYKKVMDKMATMTYEQQLAYQPEYTPHVLGRFAQARELVSTTLTAMRQEAASMQVPYIPS